MKNNNFADPIYTFEPVVNIQLFGDSVPKSFHDFIWEQAVRHLAKLGEYSDVSVADILDVGVNDYIGKKGVIAAEKCLEHWAMMGYLPISMVEKVDDGSAQFTVN